MQHEITKSIPLLDEQGNLTEELKVKLAAAVTAGFLRGSGVNAA